MLQPSVRAIIVASEVFLNGDDLISFFADDIQEIRAVADSMRKKPDDVVTADVVLQYASNCRKSLIEVINKTEENA